MKSSVAGARWRLRDQSVFVQFFLAGAGTVLAGLLGFGLASAFPGAAPWLVGVPVGAALLALAGLYLSVAIPLILLTRTLRQYERGDFRARVGISGAGELRYLQRSFNDLGERIEAMAVDLKKLDEMKTDFISTVSHELRTPLTSISGYVKLLTSGDVGALSPEQKEFLGIVDTNVIRLTHLINDILDIEKMESGNVQLIREPLDLGGVLREAMETFRIVAAQKGLELRLHAPAEPMPVFGDRGRLVQVFLNLISNAIKYTPEGIVEVEAEAREFAFLVRVRDTGVGMTTQEQENLFQKFYRTRSGLSSAERGTGLGLVIVRSLAEAHGGKVAVESSPGKGTTFTVTLPRSEKQGAAP